MNEAEHIDWDMLSDLVYLQFLVMDRHETYLRANATEAARDRELQAAANWATAMILACVTMAILGASVWTMTLVMGLGAAGAFVRMRLFFLASEEHRAAVQQCEVTNRRLSKYGH